MRVILERIPNRIVKATGFIVIALIVIAILVVITRLWPTPRPVVEQTGGQSTPPSTVSALKIFTAEAGIYELENAVLKSFGVRIDPEINVHLFSRGEERSFWIEEREGEYVLRFYADAGQSLYTSDNIFWLVTNRNVVDTLGWDEGRAREELLPAEMSRAMLSELPKGSYAVRYRAEQNLIYSPLVESGDHWFWVTIPAPGAQDFEFDLSNISTGPASLQLGFWSNTETSLSPDHRVKVSLNGELLLDESWDGKGYYRVEAEVPANTLEEGSNRLMVENPDLEGVLANNLYLDWYEVVYPRQPIAEDDRLVLTATGEELKLSGFSSPATVYSLNDLKSAVVGINRSPNEIVQNGAKWRGKSGHVYYLAGKNGYLQPVEIAYARLSPNLRKDFKNGNYVAVGPEELLRPMQPLLDWRAEQGYSVQAIPVEALYDQFNYGFPEAQAIREFLRYTTHNWNPAPRYLALVGDASYDPRGYITPAEANRLPTFLVQTEYGGETASDVLFTRLDQTPVTDTQKIHEGWLDVAVGRIPARNPEQVSALVEKTLAYEQSRPVDARVLAVADGQEATFSREARAFLDLFPSEYSQEFFSPDPGNEGANTQIVEYFNQGYFLVVYFGHGSLTMWGKDRLFSSEDVTALVNEGKLPVVVNMTCLTGLFTHPKVESLTEALLWRARGGAVAVLAPTSLTLPDDQSFLSKSLVQNLLERQPDATLGDVVKIARQQISSDQPGVQDVLLTYLLFGDPALHFPLIR